MGAVLHTLNLRLSPRDLEYIINHAADRVIVIDADLLPLLEQLDGKMPTVELVVVASEPGDWKTKLPRTVDYEDFIRGKPIDYALAGARRERADGSLLHERNHRQSERRDVHAPLDVPPHDGAVCMADTVAVFGARLRSAASCRCSTRWAGACRSRQHARREAGHAPSLHDAGDACSTSSRRGGHDLGRRADDLAEASSGDRGRARALEARPLERVTCGGSAPPVSLIRWFWEPLGVEMIQGWGMTETNPLGTLSAPRRQALAASSRTTRSSRTTPRRGS